MGSIKCWVKDINNNFPQSSGCAPFNAAWDAAGHLCCHGTLLGSCLTCCLARSPGPFQQRCSPASQSASNLKHYRWFFPPKHKDLHFSLINFIILPLANFSSLYRFLWTAALPLSVSTHVSSSTRFQYLLEATYLWFLHVTDANQLLLVILTEGFLNVNSLQRRHSSEHQGSDIWNETVKIPLDGKYLTKYILLMPARKKERAQQDKILYSCMFALHAIQKCANRTHDWVPLGLLLYSAKLMLIMIQRVNYHIKSNG